MFSILYVCCQMSLNNFCFILCVTDQSFPGWLEHVETAKGISAVTKWPPCGMWSAPLAILEVPLQEAAALLICCQFPQCPLEQVRQQRGRERVKRGREASGGVTFWFPLASILSFSSLLSPFINLDFQQQQS